MRSMQWQLGMMGTISAFAFRHRKTKKNLCRGGRKFYKSHSLPAVGLELLNLGLLGRRFIHQTTAQIHPLVFTRIKLYISNNVHLLRLNNPRCSWDRIWHRSSDSDRLTLEQCFGTPPPARATIGMQNIDTKQQLLQILATLSRSKAIAEYTEPIMTLTHVVRSGKY